MKSILFELGFRSFYVLLFYIGISFCSYFCFGLQYEYISILYQSHYQSVDFCFNTGLWQWDDIYTDASENPSSKQTLNTLGLQTYERAHAEMLTDWNEVSKLNQSKSWGLLGLPAVSYFHPLVVVGTAGTASPIWFIKGGLFFCFAWLQTYGFLLPGQLTRVRHKVLDIMHIGTLMLILCSAEGLLFFSVAAEFNIEPLDSELVYLR